MTTDQAFTAAPNTCVVRYFVCQSKLLPRFCKIINSTSGYIVQWTVFDFAEENNSVSLQIQNKESVDGFITNILSRLQKFMEIDLVSFSTQFQHAIADSQRLTLMGRPQTVWKVHGVE